MTQLSIGNFSFSIDTAQYQRLEQMHRYRWAKRDRLGAIPQREYQGKDAQTLTITGSLIGQPIQNLQALQAMAGDRNAKPQNVFMGGDDTGSTFLGTFVIDSISTTSRTFTGHTPMRIDFTITLSEAAKP